MYPGVEEAISKLPTKYQHFIKFDMGSDLTAHAANAGKNAFADFAFQYGIPTMLTIAGLGPLASSIGSIGFFPTALNTAVGFGTGYAGSKIGEWGGQKLDRLFGTNYWTPMLSLAGGMGGRVLGGWGSNRALYRGINNSHINQTNFRNLFNKDYVDDALSFYHNRQLKDLAAWEQRMAKPLKYDATVNDIYLNLIQ